MIETVANFLTCSRSLEALSSVVTPLQYVTRTDWIARGPTSTASSPLLTRIDSASRSSGEVYLADVGDAAENLFLS